MELKGNWLITGGAGYLGRAVIQAAARGGWGCKLTVYSRDEEKQWRLRHRWPDVACILGDIRDTNRLQAAVTGRDGVIHAAAVKFVPEAEFNVMETVAVNVDGTYNVATCCSEGGVGTAIFISTDKACLPVNLYGATKMVGEKIWSEMATKSKTAFVTARYGNVIGSTGSIIPVFRRQLAAGGRLKVTDPNMTRFFMTHHDAVFCILKACEFARTSPGAVVGPRCKAMSIGDLARVVAMEAGLDPNECIDIVGPRPGEKRHESLIHQYESTRTFLGLLDSESDPANALRHFLIEPTTSNTTLSPIAPITSDTADRVDGDAFLEAMADAERLLA